MQLYQIIVHEKICTERTVICPCVNCKDDEVQMKKFIYQRDTTWKTCPHHFGWGQNSGRTWTCHLAASRSSFRTGQRGTRLEHLQPQADHLQLYEHWSIPLWSTAIWRRIDHAGRRQSRACKKPRRGERIHRSIPHRSRTPKQRRENQDLQLESCITIKDYFHLNIITIDCINLLWPTSLGNSP